MSQKPTATVLHCFAPLLLLLTTVTAAKLQANSNVDDSSPSLRRLHPHPEPEFHPQAFCGFDESDTNFRTWYKGVYTDSPVLFPQDEEELEAVIRQVRKYGCKLRVRGAGHSEDGLVMLQQDNEDGSSGTVIVNFRDFSPHPDWDGVLTLNNSSYADATIKISAGASLLEMNSIVRPQGFLPYTSYPLASFSVAGAYLNPSTHGQTYGESRLAAQVVGVRVMRASGRFVEYGLQDPELKDFRGSMGMLGIVVGLEIRLRKDEGLQMIRDNFVLTKRDPNRTEELRNFFRSKLLGNNGTDFFYSAHEDHIYCYELHFQGDPSFDPKSTEAEYGALVARFPNLSYTGGQQSSFVHLLDTAGPWAEESKMLAEQIGVLTRLQADDQFEINKRTLRDGFWANPEYINKVDMVFYSVRCTETNNSESSPLCLNEMERLFSITRDYFMRLIQDDSSPWYPTMPLEWRLFTVHEDEMTLEQLTPGTYIAFENLAMQVEDGATYAKFHKELEDMWRAEFPGGGVHFGKQYAYDQPQNTGGRYYPFQNQSMVDGIFPSHVKETFFARMEYHDRNGIFRAGSVLRLLGLSDNKYTPERGLLTYDFPSSLVPIWLLWIEVAIATTCLLSFAFTYTWYRRARWNRVFSSIQEVKDGSSRLGESKSQNDDEKNLPVLHAQQFRFHWNDSHGTIIEADDFWLGGCRMTAIRGPSGSGKSTLLKLLAGYRMPHMTIKAQHSPSLPSIAMCHQSTEMWPEQMMAGDVLLYGCLLAGADPSDCRELISQLDLHELITTPFGLLSGGQKQLVNIATVLVRPTPTLILLDEPMASLDEQKAQGLLRTLKSIPTKHSFVITAHMFFQDVIEPEFDRIIQLDATAPGGFILTKGPKDALALDDSTSNDDSNPSAYSQMTGEPTIASVVPGLQAMIVMWHAQFYSRPLVEAIMLLASVIAGTVSGAMIRGAVEARTEEGHMPLQNALPMGLYAGAIFLGIAVNSGFGLPLVYGLRERKSMMNNISEGRLHRAAYLLSILLRALFFGSLQAAGMCAAFIPLAGFDGHAALQMVVNVAAFAIGWTIFTYWLVTAIPPTYSAHAVMLACSFTSLFSGVFRWEFIYEPLQIIHYFCLSFYFVATSVLLSLEEIQTGCQGLYINLHDAPLDDFVEYFIDTTCATNFIVYNEVGLPQITSLQAQGMALAYVLVSTFGIWYALFVIKGKSLNHKSGAAEHFRAPPTN